MIGSNSAIKGVLGPIPGASIDLYEMLLPSKAFVRVPGTIQLAKTVQSTCYLLTMASGIKLTLTSDQKVVVYNGSTTSVPVNQAINNLVAVMIPSGKFRWEKVESFFESSPGLLLDLTCNGNYLASDVPNLGYIMCSN